MHDSVKPLKIIYNNAWNGRMRAPWTEFIKAQAADTDIFCFQEMYDDNFRAYCRQLLPDFREYTDTKFLAENNRFHQAIYVRPGVVVQHSASLLSDQTDCGLALYLQIEHNGQLVSVCNVHGTALPVNKLDTPARIKQSSLILDFFASLQGPTIIGGDFNLEPLTQSVAMFQERGYRNLIADYTIATTRNHLVWDRHLKPQLFADYMFTSPEVTVEDFTVLDNEISDHLPMVLIIR